MFAFSWVSGLENLRQGDCLYSEKRNAHAKIEKIHKKNDLLHYEIVEQFQHSTYRKYLSRAGLDLLGYSKYPNTQSDKGGTHALEDG